MNSEAKFEPGVQLPASAPRAGALDAFRGYAILTMVLSDTEAFGILPSWMYHAQVPPPAHKFDPSIFGITWVDLVFPFFLFAMGAALPFSVGKKLDSRSGNYKAILGSFGRGAQLVFFAIYIQHIFTRVTGNSHDLKSCLISLLAFGLMFPMFMRLPQGLSQMVRTSIKGAAFLSGFVLLVILDYPGSGSFNPENSDIIILLLGNMAVFGSLAYILTFKNKLARIAILPFIMAVLIGSTNEGSWTHWLFSVTLFPWMYKFTYLKYLFLIIPGTIAGEYLLEWMKPNLSAAREMVVERRVARTIAGLSILLVVTNLYGLYSRQLLLNLILTSALLVFGIYLLRKGQERNMLLWKRLFTAGAYLLMLGLFFEAFEGGIRKDYSTYSYYFVTSGLAFITLIFFSVVCDFLKGNRYCRFLIQMGQNPMIAYVSAGMVIMPIVGIMGLSSFLALFDSNPWLGFLKGLIITSLVTLITLFFTRIKWFWRT